MTTTIDTSPTRSAHVEDINFRTSSQQSIPAVPQNFSNDPAYKNFLQNHGILPNEVYSPIPSDYVQGSLTPFHHSNFPMGLPGMSPPISPPITPMAHYPAYTAVSFSPTISPQPSMDVRTFSSMGSYAGGMIQDPFTGEQIYIPFPQEQNDSSFSPVNTPAPHSHHSACTPVESQWNGHPQQGYQSQPVLPQRTQNSMYIVASAMDRVQGLLLQQTIADCRASKDQEKLQSMFYEILPSILKVAQDPCGNFVLQRLVEAIDDKNIVDLSIERIRKDITSFAKNQYGCRVFQSILERCSNEGRLQILAYMIPDMGEILQNNFGCYVIQKLIETIEDPTDLTDFIEEYIFPQCFELSIEPNGCRVMQDVFRYCNKEQKLQLTENLIAFILDLSKDNYGNYVIQNLLHYGTEEIRTRIIQALFPHILTIGCNKAGSNILEKCFSKCPVKLRGQLTDAVIQDQVTLSKLVRNRYGNYVVQKMLACLPAKQRTCLVEKLNQHFETIEKLNDHEQHVYNQIHRRNRNNVNENQQRV